VQRRTTMSGTRILVFVGASVVTGLLAGRAGAANDGAADATLSPPVTAVEEAVKSGRLFTLTQPAALGGPAAYGMASGGYDGARRAALFEATAEVRVWGPIALRGGAVYTGDDRKLRPSLGARVQALREDRHGLDGSIGVTYRPEGLTEPEGEIEAVVAAGAHFGKAYLVGNLVYGQDPEGEERDGELRLAGLYPLTAKLLLGVDGRVRFDLGSERTAAAGRSEPQLDVLVGPTAILLVGPVALLAHGGASAVRVRSVGAYGAFLLGGVGTAF
jgi:hypothetical protein